MLPKKIFIGCSGWYYRHWKDTFYPSTIPNHHWFRFYKSQFNTVELNSPFYRWPKDSNVKVWRREALRGKKDFVYSIKLNREITHDKKLSGTKRLVQKFYSIDSILEESMGCFFWQFPPSFHYSKSNLKKLLNQIDPTRKNAVEFRHSSWWKPTVFDAFKKNKIIFCSVSAPRLPDQIIKTTDSIYVRFHGVKQWYLHDYSKEELKTWAKRIQKVKAKEVWAYFNNDRNANAIRNAKTLRSFLTKK